MRLLIGATCGLDLLDRRDRHVDGEADRVVRPGDLLAALHLFRELRHAALKFVGVAENVELIHSSFDPTDPWAQSGRLGRMSIPIPSTDGTCLITGASAGIGVEF